MALAGQSGNYVDLRYFGGITNKFVPPETKLSTDKTGKVLISTSGLM